MAVSKFQTLVDIPDFKWETGYSKKNVFMGSCFTENVGNRMADLKYQIDINPFGILYNPISVANGIQLLLNGKEFAEHDLVYENSLWHSFSHHGKFSSPDKKQTLENINSRLKISSDFLKQADFLFITFGTAWIYKLIETGETVSNCHKIPSKKFERIRLSVDEIVATYNKLLVTLWDINPELKVIFTVSPIRHWKDGAIENQRSKSVLLLAVDELIKNYDKNCAYFPSYEIVMDELRDYRFYTEDMLHISDVAITHIWEKFEEALIDRNSQKLAKEIQQINSALKHRPFNKYTKEHLIFIKKQILKLELIEQKYPFIDLVKEKQKFNEQKKDIESNLS